jgi:alpha-galactosidase
MRKRIVLVGAGSAQFGLGSIGSILHSQVLEGSEIVLLDINPSTLSAVEDKGRTFIAEHSLPFSLTATCDRAEAFKGADFIIISIEVGNRFELWEQDWRIPQQYGVRQVFGENGGPGGLFHALRIIPPILEICADARRICPQAVVCNFSNPMSRICTTVHRAFPDLQFIGFCHEISSLRAYLPQILGMPFEELALRAGGLNHFSCLLEAKYKDGRDAYPDIRAKAPDFFGRMPSLNALDKYYKETGREPKTPEDFAQVEMEIWPERRVFQIILEKFGLLPITTDSHFGEYIHWAYDVTDHQGILDFFRFYKQWLATSKPEIKLEAGEQIIPMIEGILTDSGYEEAAVNIPNTGLLPDLPDWIAVETPARVDKDGVHGIALGRLPRGFAGLLNNQAAVHDLTAEAVLYKSKAYALQALLVDPVVDHYRNVEAMLDTMITYQQPWLGYLK